MSIILWECIVTHKPTIYPYNQDEKFGIPLIHTEKRMVQSLTSTAKGTR